MLAVIPRVNGGGEEPGGLMKADGWRKLRMEFRHLSGTI